MTHKNGPRSLVRKRSLWLVLASVDYTAKRDIDDREVVLSQATL